MVNSKHIKHKIIIIGDSHVRGLSEKIGNCLDDSFSVLGISKPNAYIETITSSKHLKVENLTKEDSIIFFGGTRDISKNEAKNGLRSLKELTQRTTNTKLILLEAPHRYDLPPSSCVNNEVKLYNKRLQSFVTISDHVRVLKTHTERKQHTRHGLHLNNRGKDWIMNNIVKEIRNLNLSCKASSPIKLPWRDEMMDPGNQVTLVRVNDDMEYTNPSCKNDGQLEYRRNAKEMDSLPQVTMECPEQTSKRDSNQQDEIIPRKSTRLKQLPLIKYQDFLC